MKKLIIIIFLSIFILPIYQTALASSLLYATRNFFADDRPWSVAIGDLDGDGDLDLAVANFDSDNVSVLLGNGDDTFQTAVHYGAGDEPNSVAIGDLDGDGDLDLAVANWGSDNVSVLLGNGDGTFQAPTHYGAGNGPKSVAIGDLDGDGDLDLAVAKDVTDYGNIFIDYVSVLTNNLNITTVSVEIDIKPGSSPSSINLKKRGVIPVAIHTTENFDAATVDPTTVLLNGLVAPIRWEIYDCDEIPNPDYVDPITTPDIPETIGDGDLDLVLYFFIPEVVEEGALNEGDTEATLTGETTNGIPFSGTGDVKIVE